MTTKSRQYFQNLYPKIKAIDLDTQIIFQLSQSHTLYSILRSLIISMLGHKIAERFSLIRARRGSNLHEKRKSPCHCFVLHSSIFTIQYWLHNVHQEKQRHHPQLLEVNKVLFQAKKTLTIFCSIIFGLDQTQSSWCTQNSNQISEVFFTILIQRCTHFL